jgi:hypothetical protein
MRKLHLPIIPYGQALWQTPRLGVRIRPDFAVVDPKGKLFVVKLWLKDRPLAKDAAHAMQRLLALHMAEICPGCLPARCRCPTGEGPSRDAPCAKAWLR